jgi:gliding motility-associated-like protein
MYSLPSVTVNGNTTVCQGKNDLLTANATGGNGGYQYAWHPGTTTTQTLNVTAANVYSVTVTDAKGCSTVGSIIVKLSNPTITVNKNNFICPGKTAVIHASGSGTAPLTYTWLPSLSTNQTFSTTVAGIYTVEMTDVYGCVDSKTVSVNYNPVPVANITYNPSSPFDPGETVYFHDASTVSTGSVVSDTWTFGDTSTTLNNFNPTHAYSNGGHYAVTLFVRSDKGCLDTAVIFVDVRYPIVIPNIITPNGDGINEYLEFKNLLRYTNNKLWIYNRWGKLLYSSDDYQNNWTGKDYSDGTYYFILEVPDIRKTYKGFFTSLR